MSRGIGLEVSDRRVRVVSIETGPKRVRLLSFHEELIPPAPDDKTPAPVAETIRKAVATLNGGRGRIATSVDSGEAVVRELSVPFKTDDQIRKTAPFEFENLVHNFAIEDLVVDHFKTGETEKGTTLLAAALPKKILAAKLAVYEAAGVDAQMVDLDMAALFNAFEQTGAVASDEPFLIVYGTERFTKILLVEGRRPRSLRTIRFGIPSREKVHTERMERKKLLEAPEEEGKPDPIVVLTDTQMDRIEVAGPEGPNALIDILAKEISRFLLASGSPVPPVRVLLAGDFDNAEAGSMLEAALQIPVMTHPLLDGLDHALRPDAAASIAPRAGVALGLALKACEIDTLGLDFRRGEFAFKKKFDALKTTVLVTLELAVLLFAVIGLKHHLRHRTDEMAWRQMVEHQGDLVKRATGQEPKVPERAFDELKEYHRNLTSMMGGGEHPLERSALELWNQLFRAIDDFAAKHQRKELGGQKMHLTVERVDVSQKTTGGAEGVSIVLTGVIQNEEYANALKQEIRLVEPFKDGRWEIVEGRYTPAPEDRKRFTFTLKQGKRS